MKIVLIAGEPLFRMGFRRLMDTSTDLELVAEASDARTGFKEIDHAQPDLVVLDVTLPGMNGIAAVRELRCRGRDLRSMVLASWPCEREAVEAFAAGARGYVTKTQAPEAVLFALRTVGRGQAYLTPDLRGLSAEQLVARAGTTEPAADDDALGVLSTREREVLDLVIRGWRNRQIAQELCISIKTVDTHRTRINRKLQCAGSADLIRYAAENNLLPAASSQSRHGPTPAVTPPVTEPAPPAAQLG